MKKPFVLIIIDGFGLGSSYGNAINAAKTPNLDDIFLKNPTTKVEASGGAVGLPDGQMGNSEVGHMNIGAGRVVYQDFTRINKEIKNGDFFGNRVLVDAICNTVQKGSSLHLLGLLSDGGVHSHINHLYALLKLAKKHGMEKVYIHALLDGRDTLPTSGIDFVLDCEKKIKEIGIGKIATICGRYYAMDRDNRWDRVEKAYFTMTDGTNVEICQDPVVVLNESYKKGITDEFVVPTVCDSNGLVKENDTVIFFNFRPDRARELTKAFTDKSFSEFETKKFSNISFVCMTQYDVNINETKVAYPPENLKNTLCEYFSKLGMTQLKIAETEKYAHVTFFLNAGVEKAYVGEDRVLVNSPRVATYDLKPEMSAFEIRDAVTEKIRSLNYDFVVINFANCDMVGHTGNFDATVKAVETVDSCVGAVVKYVTECGGYTIITADHGNAEKMITRQGLPFTAHTANPVPLCVVGKKCKLRPDGKLSDIAPTILDILNIKKPQEMTGVSLIIDN